MDFYNNRKGELLVVTGNSNPDLAADVCNALNVNIAGARVAQFPNGEIDIKIHDNVRGKDVFIIQPTCANTDEGCNVNRALMEILLLVHTCKLASARRITAVIPHYGYARQDRKTTSRVPISASAVARMITEMGTDGVVTVDLHCGQIQGFFHGCPVADLSTAQEFASYANRKGFDKSKLVVVAPDAGAVTRARKLGDKIGAQRIVTILKRRVEANKVESMQLVGDVTGCICIIVDDMIDTGGTLCKAADVLKEYGATEVHAYATHGILTDPACERMTKCDALCEIVVTDSVSQKQATKKCSKLRIISLSNLLAEAIVRIHSEESMEHVRATSPQLGHVDSTPYELPDLLQNSKGLL